MFTNFTRRHKLDWEPCELRYRYVPIAFRFDLVKLVLEHLGDEENSTLREYAMYRQLSVSLNKDYVALIGEDDIYQFYSPDLFIDLVRSAQWHEVLSIIEYLENGRLVDRKTVNGLFEYHQVGYQLIKSEDADEYLVEVKYEVLVEEAEHAEVAAAQYPKVVELLRDARKALTAPQNVDVETSVSNSVKAIEAYVKEWLLIRGISAATLGDAIKEINKKKLVDPNLAEGLHQLYIYRNRQPNVGHGSVSDSKLTPSTAKLVLDMAASYINFFHRQGKAESA